MIENLAISFIILLALYFLVRSLRKSLSGKDGCCPSCSLSKKGFNCKELKEKIKQKD